MPSNPRRLLPLLHADSPAPSPYLPPLSPGPDSVLETLLLHSPPVSSPVRTYARMGSPGELLRPDVVVAVDDACRFPEQPAASIAIGPPAVSADGVSWRKRAHGHDDDDHHRHEEAHEKERLREPSDERSEYQDDGHSHEHDHGHNLAHNHDHDHPRSNGGSCGHDHSNDGWRKYLPHSHSLEARLAADTRSLKIAFAILLSAFILQLIASFLASSSALMVEAVHSALDGLSVIISLISVIVAARKPTSQYSYGYSRAEVLSALVSVGALGLLCVKLFFGAAERLFHILKGTLAPIHVQGRIVFVAEAIILVSNIFMAFVLTAGSSSLNIRALRAHVIADSVENIVVLSAGLIMWLVPSASIIDPILTLCIVVLIVFLNAGIATEAITTVMQATPPSIDVEEGVLRELAKIPSVSKVGTVHLWTMTSGSIVGSAEVFVEDEDSTLGFREVEGIRRDADAILRKYGVSEVTVQVSLDSNDEYSSESDELNDFGGGDKDLRRHGSGVYEAVDRADALV